MAYVTPKIELELAGLGLGWTDVTTDVVGGVRIGYGIRGAGPNDRTASAGSMSFSLNNSTGNSAATLGYYSTYSTACRAGWRLGVRVRAQFYDPASAAWYVKFIGTVIQVTPQAGTYVGGRTVQVVATDWIDEAARATVYGLATQLNKRSDQIISALVGNVTRQPAATSIATGKDTYAYALDTARDDTPNPVLQEIARVVASEQGYFYVKGDGTATFEARFGRLTATDALTLSDTMTGLDATCARESMVTRVQAVTHPRTVDTVTKTLYTLQSVVTLPVDSTIQLLGGYTDPLNRAQRVGGTSMIAPVASTDYKANTAADGSGFDRTAQIAVSASFGGNGVRFTVTNNSGITVYLTKLQARGLGIYDYENTVGEAVDTAMATDFGDQVVSIDMPYQSDPTVGLNAAKYVLNLYGAETIGVWSLGTAGAGELGVNTQLAYRRHTSVSAVRLSPATAALQTQILAREIGDRIKVIETVTGIARSFYINAIDLDVRAPGLPFVTWTLAPADLNSYWLLGTSGFGELGNTTRLAYS